MRERGRGEEEKEGESLSEMLCLLKGLLAPREATYLFYIGVSVTNAMATSSGWMFSAVIDDMEGH